MLYKDIFTQTVFTSLFLAYQVTLFANQTKQSSKQNLEYQCVLWMVSAFQLELQLCLFVSNHCASQLFMELLWMSWTMKSINFKCIVFWYVINFIAESVVKVVGSKNVFIIHYHLNKCNMYCDDIYNAVIKYEFSSRKLLHILPEI